MFNHGKRLKMKNIQNDFEQLLACAINFHNTQKRIQGCCNIQDGALCDNS